MADPLALIASARASLSKDPKLAYDELAATARKDERHLHPTLMALSGADPRGGDTRAFLAAEPRWIGFLGDIARDASIHNDYRVRALAFLSRIKAPEPREMVLDFAGHTDFEDLAEILRAYEDPILLEAFVSKISKGHQKALALFINLPKPKAAAKTPPKKSPSKPAAKRKPR